MCWGLRCMNCLVSVHAVCNHITCLRFHAFSPLVAAGISLFCIPFWPFIRCLFSCTNLFRSCIVIHGRAFAHFHRIADHFSLSLSHCVSHTNFDCYRMSGSCFAAISGILIGTTCIVNKFLVHLAISICTHDTMSQPDTATGEFE